MKRFSALILTAALALSLAACGGGGDNTSGSGGAASSKTDGGGAETLSLSQEMTVGDWTFKVNKVEFGDARTMDDHGADYLLRADAEYKASCMAGSSRYFQSAEAGKIFLFFEGTLGYEGKTTMVLLSSAIDFSVGYGDGYTFESYEFAIAKEAGAFVDPLYGTFSQNDITFEPMDAVRVCRGYFELPAQVIDDMDEQIQLNVKMMGKEFTYVFPVKDAYGYSTDPETVMEMAKIFGGDGDGYTDWTENSFPYFDEMRGFFSLMSDKQIKDTMVGKWITIDYGDDSGDTRERIFYEDGTGIKQEHKDDPEEEYGDFYWSVENGLNIGYKPGEVRVTWRMYQASDDVLVYYDNDHARMVFMRGE